MCDTVNIDYMARHFDKIKNVGRVLEVGSYNANGNFKEFFMTKGISYLGIDIAPGPDVDLICDITADFSEIVKVLGQSTFDAIICANVLEHLYEPIKALNNMRKLLRDDGFLIIITPLIWDLHSWPQDYFRLNPDFYRRYSKDNGLRILEDTFNLSVRNTRKIFSSIDTIPMIVPDLYKKGILNILLRALGRFFVPELQQCWPHVYLNLICQKMTAPHSN